MEKEVKVLTKEQKRKIRELVEVYYDYQDSRVRTANRLAVKKNGEEQKKDFPNLPLNQIPEIDEFWKLFNDKPLKYSCYFRYKILF